MRIAYVINDAAFFVSHRLPLALSVIKKGGSVCVITGQNINVQQERDAIIHLKKYKIIHKECYFTQGVGNIFFEIIGVLQLVYYLRNFDPTTIHSASSKGNFLAAFSSNFVKKTNLILSVSGLGTFFVGKRNLKKQILFYIYKKILNFSFQRLEYKIIFQNNDDYLMLNSIIKLKDHSINFVYGSGVKTNYFRPSKFGIKTRNVLLPARLLDEKGVNEFIEAIRILKKRNVKGNFFLAGDNNSLNPSVIPSKKIEAWVNEGLVNALGHQKNMKKLYQEMSIICLPSWREGFPKVLMEAASCGIPIITTNVPGCKDAIINNVTGFIVPLKNSQELADAIHKLLDNFELRKNMGNEGRKLALKKFDLDLIVPQVLKLYK